MTYLVGSHCPGASAGRRFRALLAHDQILQMPGTHNGLTALQAKAADALLPPVAENSAILPPETADDGTAAADPD